MRNWIARYRPLLPSCDTAFAKSLGVDTARSRLPGLPKHPRCACVFNTLPRHNRATFDTLHWVTPLSPSFANSGLSRWTRRLSMRNPQRFHIVLSVVLRGKRLLTFRQDAPPFVHFNLLSIEWCQVVTFQRSPVRVSRCSPLKKAPVPAHICSAVPYAMALGAAGIQQRWRCLH